MKIRSINNLVLILIAIGHLSSCSKDDTKNSQKNEEIATLNLSINNVVGNEELVLNNQTYTNTSGEKYTITDFKYILSNIELTSAEGETFRIPKEESYFLTTEAKPESLSIDLPNIPVGNYTTIKFGIGIDPGNYPIETGTLSLIEEAEAEQMLWKWAAGYQFVKIEGDFSTSSNTQTTPYKLHIGSLGDKQDNYKEVVLILKEVISVDTQNKAKINIKVDASKVFDAKNTISLEATPSIQVDIENSPLVSENTQLMFEL